MKIIPAIDLLGGRCVRLQKGSYSDVTVYYEDPAEAAAVFQSLGVPRLHVVDLDAARGLGKNNREALRKIAAVFDGEIEVGGGVRSENDIEELLKAGADFLIAGTVLAKEPETVGRWVRRYGARFIAGIDALKGEVRVSGWEKGSGLRDEDLAKRAAEIGFAEIIYTNIDKDGMMSGPDIENTERIAEASGLPVILSGGVSRTEDLYRIAESGGIDGAIVGKAFYEKTVDLEEALKRLSDRS